MASFDFVTSASRAYEFVWYYKGYLARVIVPVLFIEVFCALSVITLGDIEKLGILRYGLIMMPAYCLEALYFAMLARFVLYHEPIFIWGKPIDPPPLSKGDKVGTHIKGANRPRKQSLQVSVAIYLLVVIFFTLLMWGAMLPATEILPMTPEEKAANIDHLMPAPLRFLIALCVFSAIVWCTRLYILSVPASMGFAVRTFLSKMGGINNSAKLLVLIFLCGFPVIAILAPVLGAFLSLISEIASLAIILQVVLWYALGLLVYSIAVVGLTFAIEELMTSQEEEQD